MLEHNALHFSRADLLGDPHEGAVSELTIQERAALTGRDMQLAQGLSDYEDLGRLMVRGAYVSCWNVSDVENAGLWNLYGGGVAICSTFEKLRSSLLCADAVYIGMVRYIDYQHDRIPTDNAFEPLMHKRRYFEHENELRAVIRGKWIEEDGDSWHWAREDPRHGISAEVDLNRLVDEVRIAPGDRLLGEVVPSLATRCSS